MRDNFLTLIGAIFGAVGALFSHLDSVIITLVIFMTIDFIIGIIAASVFKVSKHAEAGLESRVCWKGIYKKGIALLICLMASYFDQLLGTVFIHNAVAIGFIVSESISIIENAGLIGVPVPAQLKDAIAILKDQSSA